MHSASLLLELLLSVVFQPLAILNPLDILEIISTDARNRRHTKTINFLCSYNKTSGLKRLTIKYNQAWRLRKPQLNAFPPSALCLSFHSSPTASSSTLQHVSRWQVQRLQNCLSCAHDRFLSVGRDTVAKITVTRKNICILRKQHHAGSWERYQGWARGRKGAEKARTLEWLAWARRGEAGHQSCRLRITGIIWPGCVGLESEQTWAREFVGLVLWALKCLRTWF